MQSSMLHFCDECGAANLDDAIVCAACQQPFLASGEVLSMPTPVLPVVVVPVVPLEVVAGSPASSKPLGPGMLLKGRYRILREIGRGGFGSVYQARDIQERGRLVAVKQIDLNKLKPQEIIEATDSFNREVTLLSALKHPNLPRFYAHFTDASHWYLVMEYIPGQTLEDYLKHTRRGYLSFNKVMDIGKVLADVLAYLHGQRQPVIFRDVKPANIMITHAGHIYLIDFGIARQFSPKKSKDTGPLGSPGYAAPEQYGRRQSDQRTDIYGLGATLQTLLTGRDPLELRLGQPSLNAKPMPTDMQVLLTSMLERSPAERPQDMTVVSETCEKFIRREHNLLELCRGFLIGLIFPLCYLLIASVLSPLAYTTHNPASPSFSLYDLLVVSDSCFRVTTLGTIAFLLVSLMRTKRRWLIIGVLSVLFLMILLAIFGILPSVYAPFYPR